MNSSDRREAVLPAGPITLTAEQVRALDEKLSKMRHDVNNHGALIVAAAELIRLDPNSFRKWATTFLEQPHKIEREMEVFTAEFDRAFGIARPQKPGIAA
jgi:hypothetical protein